MPFNRVALFLVGVAAAASIGLWAFHDTWQGARENEAEIWRVLVTEKRTVTREAYRQMAEALQPLALVERKKTLP